MLEPGTYEVKFIKLEVKDDKKGTMIFTTETNETVTVNFNLKE